VAAAVLRVAVPKVAVPRRAERPVAAVPRAVVVQPVVAALLAAAGPRAACRVPVVEPLAVVRAASHLRVVEPGVRAEQDLRAAAARAVE
jgi:hypothetical protein